MATRTRQLRRHEGRDDWYAGGRSELWVCDSDLRRLFDIPRTINRIVLCASEKPQSGTIKVAHKSFNLADVNGDTMGLYPKFWNWFFKGLPVSTVWYCWIEYDTNDERN